MGLHVVAMCVVIPLLSVHSRPTWYIEESRKSFCNKGSGQKRLPDLPCQVNWRRDVNFFVQSLPYCIFFNNTNCMKQLLQTQGDGNEKDLARSKYGHASPRYKKNRHQSAHGILISICPSHKRITVDQNARTANVVRPTEHKHFDQDGLIWSWRKPSFSASSFNSCTVS